MPQYAGGTSPSDAVGAHQATGRPSAVGAAEGIELEDDPEGLAGRAPGGVASCSSSEVDPPGALPASPSGSSSSSMPSAAPTAEGRPVAWCAPTASDGEVPPAYWGMHVTSPIGDDFPDVPITAVNLTTSGVYWSQ